MLRHNSLFLHTKTGLVLCSVTSARDAIRYKTFPEKPPHTLAHNFVDCVQAHTLFPRAHTPLTHFDLHAIYARAPPAHTEQEKCDTHNSWRGVRNGSPAQHKRQTCHDTPTHTDDDEIRRRRRRSRTVDGARFSMRHTRRRHSVLVLYIYNAHALCACVRVTTSIGLQYVVCRPLKTKIGLLDRHMCAYNSITICRGRGRPDHRAAPRKRGHWTACCVYV